MASKEVFFRGKVRWFKLLGQGDAQYKSWNTVLYLTPESHTQFLELKKGTDTTDGILNELKQDEDGYYINLKRPWLRKNRDNSEVSLVPPVVLDSNNIPWDHGKQIGNGSDVTCKCDYYTFKAPFKQKRGSAIRLVSARIEDLVPYEPKRDFTEDQQKAAKGLDQPAAGVQYF